MWAATCDFKQFGILTSVGSDEPESLLLSLETPNDVWSFMQGNILNLHTPSTSGVELNGHILKLCRCKIFVIKPKHQNIPDRRLL